MKDNINIKPFSNGSEAMIWYSENCELCTKAFFPKNGEYPSDQTMKNYCSIGKECKLKYSIDLGFITGEIPLYVANQIGWNGSFLNENCMMFSDNSDDGFNYPKKNKPDNTPDNQLLMFSEFDELLNPKPEECKSKVLETI